MERIAAEEQLAAVVTACAPWMSDESRDSMIDRLQDVAGAESQEATDEERGVQAISMDEFRRDIRRPLNG